MHIRIEIEDLDGYWKGGPNFKGHILIEKKNNALERGGNLYLAEKTEHGNLTGRTITAIIDAVDDQTYFELWKLKTPAQAFVSFRILHQCTPESCTEKVCLARDMAKQTR